MAKVGITTKPLTKQWGTWHGEDLVSQKHFMPGGAVLDETAFLGETILGVEVDAKQGFIPSGVLMFREDGDVSKKFVPVLVDADLAPANQVHLNGYDVINANDGQDIELIVTGKNFKVKRNRLPQWEQMTDAMKQWVTDNYIAFDEVIS